MGDNHDGMGHDKVGIRTLGSLISLYQNVSSRVLWNDIKTSILFFERLYDFRKNSLLSTPSCYDLNLISIWVIQIGIFPPLLYGPN